MNAGKTAPELLKQNITHQSIYVIADDLTGAAEIAGVCLRYKLSVCFGIDIVPETNADVCVIATDSRSMSEEQAYKTHLQLAELIFNQFGDVVIFKKCDSVLRGFVLTEIIPLLTVFKKDKVLIQPTNPVVGRVIRSGGYYVDDVLINKTGFAIDPDFPALDAQVDKILLNRTTKFEKEIKIFTGKIKIENSGCYLSDCESIDDLSLYAGYINKNILAVGSAAFFEQYLLKLFPLIHPVSTSKFLKTDNFLLISGSTHPESVRFANSMESQNCPVLRFSEKLLQNDPSEKDYSNWLNMASEFFNENSKLLIRIADEKIIASEISLHLKNRLSKLTRELIETNTVKELFIEGGATAYDILNVLSWKSFNVIAEIAPGVVRLQLDHSPATFITIKPGSYRWPEGLF